MLRIDHLREIVRLLEQRYDVSQSEFRLMIRRQWLADALLEMYRDTAARINNLDVRHEALHRVLTEWRFSMWLNEVLEPLEQRARRVAQDATELFGIPLEDVHPKYFMATALAYHRGGRFGFQLEPGFDGMYYLRRVVMTPEIAVNSCQCPQCNIAPVEACESVNNHRIQYIPNTEISPWAESTRLHVHACPRCDLRWICIEGSQLR